MCSAPTTRSSEAWRWFTTTRTARSARRSRARSSAHKMSLRTQSPGCWPSFSRSSLMNALLIRWPFGRRCSERSQRPRSVDAARGGDPLACEAEHCRRAGRSDGRSAGRRSPARPRPPRRARPGRGRGARRRSRARRAHGSPAIAASVTVRVTGAWATPERRCHTLDLRLVAGVEQQLERDHRTRDEIARLRRAVQTRATSGADARAHAEVSATHGPPCQLSATRGRAPFEGPRDRGPRSRPPR